MARTIEKIEKKNAVKGNQRLSPNAELHLAMRDGDAIRARKAIVNGARGEKIPASIGNALMVGVKSGASVECVRVALSVCDPKERDAMGRTALMMAAARDRADLLALLLPLSEPKAKSHVGVDALMAAIDAEASAETILALIPASDAKTADADGKTALMRAATKIRPEIVKALAPLSDVAAVDNHGLDAFGWHKIGWIQRMQDGEDGCAQALREELARREALAIRESLPEAEGAASAESSQETGVARGLRL
jgi:hypothetical protein